MIINLIKFKQMFSLTLPNKVKGQYWVTDIDENGSPRNLISVEAVRGEWVVKSNKFVSILDAENKPVVNTVLKPLSFFNLKIADSKERVIGIIAFILSMDHSHGISKILIFPRAIFNSKIFVETLAADAKHPAIE